MPQSGITQWLRHALPTAQGRLSLDGRWVYALGKDAHAPFEGDAPILPGFESAQDAIITLAARRRVCQCRRGDLPLYAHLVNLFVGGSMPPPMHSVLIHETCSLGQHGCCRIAD